MIERLIFNHLVTDEVYMRKVIPFIRAEYFVDRGDRTLFEVIEAFINKHNVAPSPDVLLVEIDKLTHISDDEAKDIVNFINNIEPDEKTNLEWLIDQTEKFCQDKALYNAIKESISILDDKKATKDKGSIPHILSQALAVSFDTAIGHDFIEDAALRYEFYHKLEKKIPFDIEFLNKITKGGVSTKTLNIVMAGTGVGKSLFMCHLAAANLAMGKNVLYITLEMAEERIAERIDANLLNVTLDELEMLPFDVYKKKIDRVRAKTKGTLVIKEYPTASAGANHFRHLLNELKLKKNFRPDVIYIDYLNICVSSRLKMGSNVNSYTYVKAIAEEIRGLAVEFDVPIWSATQTTRSGSTNSDPDLTDTSESFGLPATSDLFIVLVVTEELLSLGQMLIKQLKNRYSDFLNHTKFVVGVDRAKFKLYDVEQHAQENIAREPPAKRGGPGLDKGLFDSFG